MKTQRRHVIGLTTLSLLVPAAADVIYSNLQNIAIPNTYAGVYLDVNGSSGWNTDMFNPVAGWDINLFFSGLDVANAPGFQPLRSGTTSMSAILNLAAGTSIGSGSVFSTFVQGAGGETPGAAGYGGSIAHMGNAAGQFTAGTEGYIGFRLNGTGYGWMRVVLGGATPVIEDWAYDTSGAAIGVGNVQQNAAGQPVTLNSAAGSLALGSQITGSNSVVKTGTGTTTLTAANSYNGATTIQQGTLAIGIGGSISNSTSIIVGDAGSSGAVLDVSALSSGFTIGNTQTLKGIGTLVTGTGAAKTTNNGILAPGNSIGTLNITGDYAFGSTSIYQVETNATSSDKIAISGAASIVTGAAITFSGSTGLGKYVLASAASGLNSGTFTGTAPTDYRLAYSTTELDLIHKATIGTINASAAAASIITGGSTDISFTVSNSAPTNSDSLAFSATSGSNTSGSVTGPVGVAAGAVSGTTSGLSFTGTTVGAGQTGSFAVSDIAATNSPQSASVSVNVYDHASGTASGTLNLGTLHAGYSVPVASSNNLSAANASGYRVDLAGSAEANGKISLNSLSGIAAGSSGNITATLATGQTAGVINQGFTYTFADSSALAGASSNVGTASLTVSGQVYSGAMIWTGTSGNFDTNSQWNDSADANVHVAPGLDASFTGVDTATFSGAGGTVSLNGAAPNVNALTLAGSGSYTIAGNSGITLAGTNPSISATGTHTISAPVSGSGGFTKTGAGTLVLSGSNDYTGLTTIAAGRLLVDGSNTGNGAVNVDADTTLGGTGSIAGAVNVAGTLAPGASIGTLTSGALSFTNGSTFIYEMNSTVGSYAADLQVVTGNLTLDSSLGSKVYLRVADLAGTPTGFAPNTTLSLINYAGTFSGGFFTYVDAENVETSLPDGAQFTLGANTWKISYTATAGGLNVPGDDTGHFINLTNLTAIPEPGSLLALGGLLSIGLCLRNRRR
ncbi:MAG: autotransporter-associated beta strand repeat-containing protein [Verrucomicrobiota bacterium]